MYHKTTLELFFLSVIVVATLLSLKESMLFKSGPDILVRYYLSYFISLFVCLPIYHLSQEKLKETILATGGFLFFAFAVSWKLALFSLLGVGYVYFIFAPSFTKFTRVLLFLLGVFAFYTCVPAQVFKSPIGFDFPRIYMMQNLIIAGILVTSFKRLFFYFHEASSGKIKKIGFLQLYNYLVGFPFLLGFGITASYSHFTKNSPQKESHETIEKGVKTFLVCLFCFVLWYGLSALYGLWNSGKIETDAALFQEPLWQLWLGFSRIYLSLYLIFMFTQQMSVGIWRLLGYPVPDDYRSPLLSRSITDYWRRWNALWREYFLQTVFYPMALWLTRKRGRRSPWIFALAGWSTFIASSIFNFLPEAFFFFPFLKASILNRIFSVICFYFVIGFFAAFELYREALRKRRQDIATATPIWKAPLQVVITFLLIAAIRFISVYRYPLGIKLRLVLRAFGF